MGNGPAAQRDARRGKPAPQEAADAARRRSGADAGPSGASQSKGDGRADGFFAETPDGTRFAAASFAELHLSRPLLKAVAELGYTRTTPIQARRWEFRLRELCRIFNGMQWHVLPRAACEANAVLLAY